MTFKKKKSIYAAMWYLHKIINRFYLFINVKFRGKNSIGNASTLLYTCFMLMYFYIINYKTSHKIDFLTIISWYIFIFYRILKRIDSCIKKHDFIKKEILKVFLKSCKCLEHNYKIYLFQKPITKQ